MRLEERLWDGNRSPNAGGWGWETKAEKRPESWGGRLSRQLSALEGNSRERHRTSSA